MPSICNIKTLFGELLAAFTSPKKLQKLQAPTNGVASSSGEKLGKLVFALKSEKHLSRCFPSFSPPLLFQLACSSARPRRPIPSPRRPSPLPNPLGARPRRPFARPRGPIPSAPPVPAAPPRRAAPAVQSPPSPAPPVPTAHPLRAALLFPSAPAPLRRGCSSPTEAASSSALDLGAGGDGSGGDLDGGGEEANGG